MIHNLETNEQKVVEITEPWMCAASERHIAVTAAQGLHLLAHDGTLIQILPDSKNANCVAFHPHNPDLIAVGFKDGSVRFWNVPAQAQVASFKEHTDCISSIRFGSDVRLFLSSWDNSASIITLDDHFNVASKTCLLGHTKWVNDILPLPSSSQCVTGSTDQTSKVWDCQTGQCLRTLTEHSNVVSALGLHPAGRLFASGSPDGSVAIWSCESFQLQHRVWFPHTVTR